MELPDGLDRLRRHNLLTYKSKREAVDGWTLDELLGHFVNYRKLLEDERGNLPALSDFQLYAVATRHPQALTRDQHLCPTTWPGVYYVVWGTQTVRLIVLNRITQHPRNAFWELFSSQQTRIWHGAKHYRPRRLAVWELLYYLYLIYILENPAMAKTIEEFAQHVHQQFLQNIPLTERRLWLARLPPEERLRGLSPEEVLSRYTPEERLRGLSPEELQQTVGSVFEIRSISLAGERKKTMLVSFLRVPPVFRQGAMLEYENRGSAPIKKPPRFPKSGS